MGLTRDDSNSSFFDDSVHAGKKLFTHDGAWKGLPDGTVRDTKAAAPVSVNHDRTPVIGFLSPPAIYAQVVEYGAEKARMPWWKTFWLGILAGIYLSFSGAWAYAVGGRMPMVQEQNPGLQELVFACFGLPFGLALIVICGAELYTTNAAYMAAAFYEGRANVTQVAKNWVCSFFGNLVGSLLVVWLLDETYLYDVPGADTWPYKLAQLKTGQKFGQEVLRAIFCNFLVCLAMWQATAAQDIIGKIFGIFFPVSAFVSMSFSHVVANMYWVVFAMKMGAPISVGRYIGSSMIPDLIGNTIAAVFFLSGSYAFIYGTLSGRVYSLFCRMTGNQVHAKVPENHTVDKSGKLQTAEGIAAENGDIENVDDKA